MITCTFEDGGKAKLRHVVVHAIMVKNEKILLEKRSGNLLESGKWALPSGFLDRDETAEKCVIRELIEETGWLGKVTGLFRVNTNPNRPKEDRQNVALEFLVAPVKKVARGGSEVSKVEWISFKKLLSFISEDDLHNFFYRE